MVLMQLSPQDLLLLRMHYAEDFGIVAGDAHYVAVGKFLNLLARGRGTAWKREGAQRKKQNTAPRLGAGESTRIK